MINKLIGEKKPLITAIFLAIGLLGAEFRIGAPGAEGSLVLGGPSDFPESSYIIIDERAALNSKTIIGDSLGETKLISLSETEMLRTALKSAGEFAEFSEVASKSVEVKDGLPDLGGYFAQPTTGVNWGRLHSNNAVDIANSCGTAVIAAAEGVVISDKNFSGDDWNNGYGGLILLEHPNGTRTRYAHLEKVSVKIGEYVEKRQRIGTIGNTGNSTGCHLHFEIEGAKNPFVR